MALQIEWTIHAQEDYRQIVDYLQKEWSLKVAAEFINNLEERVQNVSFFPHIGIASVKDHSIRSIIIKHNKLYYRTRAEKIEVLDIFDTRQSLLKNRYD